jgi:rod shape-determining protein MreD
MRWIILATAAVIALLMEVTLFDRLDLGGGRPDLVLTLALLVALTSRRLDLVSAAAWLSGLLVDFVSGARFGTCSLFFLLAALVAYVMKRIVSGDSLPGQVFLVGTIVLVLNLLEGLWVARGASALTVGLVAWHAAATAAYTVLLVPFLSWAGYPLFRKFGRDAEF